MGSAIDFALTAIFVLAYTAIAAEQKLQVDKSASALLAAGALWTIYALMGDSPELVAEQFNAALTATAHIVFFLMGAMTIVEVVDAHQGFDVLTSRIRAQRLSGLLWIVGLLTFFLSAILDNLTTALVMLSLVRRLLPERQVRLPMAGLIIIAANAGGAWSPIGDVTTTMLWIGGHVSAVAILKSSFLPSLINLLVPLLMLARSVGTRPVTAVPTPQAARQGVTTALERNVMFALGLGVLILVPAFKTLTHLPPVMGILFGLGALWAVGDLLHRRAEDFKKQQLTITRALARIDMASMIFFAGILLAVAVLEHAHILSALALTLERTIARTDIVVLVIGLVSAVVDNVPLVAAAMGMFDVHQYPTDSFVWTFLAYCAGTGGSILIIGSAAGVAAMGIEKIAFGWYLRKISGLALLGYFAGAALFMLQHATEQ